MDDFVAILCIPSHDNVKIRERILARKRQRERKSDLKKLNLDILKINSIEQFPLV